MKNWQFFLILSSIYGAPNVSATVAVALQAFCLACALIAFYMELKK